MQSETEGVYPDSSGNSVGGEIKLPKPRYESKISVEEAIKKRQSVRAFQKKTLSREQISQLLWVTYGWRDVGKVDAITGPSKTVPSAGALYPMEIYLVAPDGLFRYLPDGHKLQRLKEQDLRKNLARAALWQSAVSEAAIALVITAVYSRITGKYGQRGIRYSWIEAGHIAQNIHLQAVALGLGSVPIGAFDDKAVQKVLGLPREHEPLYIIPVGYPR